MNIDQKLEKKLYDQIWQEYCGFLDLSLAEFMDIQCRLLMEQIEIYARCELGKRIMKGNKPRTVDEYRRVVPLTQYEDYADILLHREESALPSKPRLWIETTWEGAKNPIKLAPYTDSMMGHYTKNLIASIILATSEKKGRFTLRGGENFLYGMAPLPYLTGIVPHVLSGELSVNFLPPTREAEAMSFGQRTRLGLSMGKEKGIDLFFGLSSVMVKIGQDFSASPGESGDKASILPKDIWKLKGLICAGTDSVVLKEKIEQDWGVKPLEIFGGTEPANIATETWSKNGLVFFPDVCFYEFIPRPELDKNMEDPTYIPKTFLLDEVIAGQEYELVISNFKGGAFARYRVGDMFQCISLINEKDGIHLPQFRYIDRIPKFIDIAGFTRITENTINEAIKLSKLDIGEWFAVKEFRKSRQSFLHLYIEAASLGSGDVMTEKIVKEQLSIFFRHIDSDYQDVEALLGIDPLEISIVPTGTINQFGDTFQRNIRRMNPSALDVSEVLRIAGT